MNAAANLWTAYQTGDERLKPFFAHRVGGYSGGYSGEPLDGAAIAELSEANAAWSGSPRATATASRLADPQTRVIACGQQAGLLGGPLYTLYKAIATVRWAERIERERHVPVVPVFWVASEDDDFNEVRSFRWPDAQGRWQRHGYESSRHRPGMPIYDVAVEPHLAKDLGGIFAATRQTEFTATLRERLEAIAAASDNFETLFIRTLAWLLGDRTPLFVSPRMKWVRRRAAKILARELAAPGESSRRIIAAGERLAALGFAPSLRRRPEHVNAFVARNGLRHKILFKEGAFEIIAPSGERERIEPQGLRAELENDPSQFSLNVATRPIVQDSLLPTLATVAGPGEVGYFAQLREAYEFFGAPMPMILPRPQVCLIEPRVERALAKLHIALEAMMPAIGESPAAFDALAQTAVEPWDVERNIRAVRERMNESLGFAGSQADLSDPAVARSFERLREAVATGLDKLAERQRHAAATRDEETVRAVSAVRESLWPEGLLQERALTVFFPFLNSFGPAMIERLFDAMTIDEHGIQPIVLSRLASM